jgi:hypothetical protein
MKLLVHRHYLGTSTCLLFGRCPVTCKRLLCAILFSVQSVQCGRLQDNATSGVGLGTYCEPETVWNCYSYKMLAWTSAIISLYNVHDGVQ